MKSLKDIRGGLLSEEAGKGYSPGWMLKHPDGKKLALKLQRKKELERKRQKSYGNPSAGISVKKEEAEQVDEAPRHKHLATFMPDDDSGEKGPIHVPVDAEDGELAHHQKLQSIIGRERAKKYRLHGVFPRKTVEESNQGIEEVEQIDESLDKDVDKYAHHAYSAHVAYSENDGHVGDDHRATARDILKSISSEHGHVGVSWAQARADQLISDYNRELRRKDIDATKQSYIRNRNLVPLKEYRNRTR
jgi:hypothetical protein